MLGSSIAASWRAQRPHDELITVTRADLDLLDRDATRDFFAAARPDAVLHAAARVAGIHDKLARPDDFLAENLRIDDAVFSAALASGVQELLYVSSAAIYPIDATQPIVEEAILGGPLEPANEGYGLAKIVGARRCESASRQYGVHYRAAVPSNLYGPGDDARPGRSHLVASIVQKMLDAIDADAPVVEVWGDGTARRELTFSRDLAAWLVTQIGSLAAWPPLLNLGPGVDHSIRECYELAARLAGFEGRLEFDASKPGGVSARLLDSSRARALGWSAPTPLEDGIATCLSVSRAAALTGPSSTTPKAQA